YQGPERPAGRWGARLLAALAVLAALAGGVAAQAENETALIRIVPEAKAGLPVGAEAVRVPNDAEEEHGLAVIRNVVDQCLGDWIDGDGSCEILLRTKYPSASSRRTLRDWQGRVIGRVRRRLKPRLGAHIHRGAAPPILNGD